MCENGHIDRRWTQPDAGAVPALCLYNSLVNEKVPFVPAAGAESRSISWYTCGPTVYDVSHMGHARNYVTFDIVRRVLEDYFGYNIQFIMNVTDVDDKIIQRARRNHLVQQYLASKGANDFDAVVSEVKAAVNGAINKQDRKAADAAAAASAEQADAKKKEALIEIAKGEELKLTKLRDMLQAVQSADQQFKGGVEGIAAVVEAGSDALAADLDAQHGASVTDTSIFQQHARKYEREFFVDMDELGCRRPDVLTRVTEYVDEIVQYIARIVEIGIAYESNGSVYFSVEEFKRKEHVYAKLSPWAAGNTTLAAESEANFQSGDKRHPCDFALWKASKPGEPSWPSPWGAGRPGWHIECSAMASHILGAKLDIHSGGEDLKFPHHDNELAQAEAYYHHDNCHQWVNYFLHAGHLTIEGLKMSKSLKNFITIREALKQFSARQIRLLFTLQPWHKPMTFSESTKQEMQSKENRLQNFFQNVDVQLRKLSSSDEKTWTTWNHKWTNADNALNQQICEAQRVVHERLLDNIDTAGAMEAILTLVSNVNNYLNAGEHARQPLLLRKAAAFVTRILSCFGLSAGQGDSLAFMAESSGAEDKSIQYIDALAAFRDEIRGLVKGKAAAGQLLQACDKLRDGVLVDLGILLEDKPDGKAEWKSFDPVVLKKMIQDRDRRLAEAALEKEEKAHQKQVDAFKKLEQLAKQVEGVSLVEDGMAATRNASPDIAFPQHVLKDKYAKFDDSGAPIADKDGNALEGKALDNAKKAFAKQQKAFQKLSEKWGEYPAHVSAQWSTAADCLRHIDAELQSNQEALKAKRAALDADA